jgi:PAS domain S-box-containing protein
MRKPDAKAASVLYDALDAGIAVVAADGRVVDWNAWLASASNVPKERAIGAQLETLFAEGLQRRLRGAISQAFEFGASSLLTHTLHPRLLPLRTKAGRQLVHDVSVKPLGDMPYRECVIQVFDVTTAAERERVLRERQNARYAAVVDSAPDAILTIDSEGVIQIANTAVEREFGYTPFELVGQPAATLFADAEDWQKVWRSIMTGAGQHSTDIVGRRKNGSLTHLEIAASRWNDRTRGFVTAILRDVNERFAAEAALRNLNETLEERVALALAQRKLLADIVEDTDAFIQVVDPELRLLAMNRAAGDEFERMYGIRPQRGVHLIKALADFPEEARLLQVLWRRALEGEAFSVTREILHRSGARRHHEMKFKVLRDSRGEQIGGYQFVYDVTDRIEREQQLANTEDALRQAQKMEAIGQLTGGIAHDFNNLLAGIIGAMELLKRRIRAGRYEDTERFMDAAVGSANRAAALTHRLLAFARRQPLAPKPLDPNQLVLSMEELLRRTIGEQIQLKTELEAVSWPVNTDANQLENAILNLAINARDAMPDGGELSISTRNTTLTRALRDPAGEIAPGDYVLICVTDTGSGMSDDVISKVFDPFFTTKPIGQGTGLGLSMVYGFAQQSGGHARIESAVGEGTTISLYLPRFTGALESDAALPSAEPLVGGEGETVLLVEDDSAVRLLIGEVLRDLGYRCIEAIDGYAALPFVTSNARLDLLITDVGLPRMNGRQLAELARQHRPGLKILFVTGYAEHATGVEKFLEPGMELVTKPFTLDSLALKIRDMIVNR